MKLQPCFALEAPFFEHTGLVHCIAVPHTKTMPGAVATFFCTVLHKTIPSCNPPTHNPQKTMQDVVCKSYLTMLNEKDYEDSALKTGLEVDH